MPRTHWEITLFKKWFVETEYLEAEKKNEADYLGYSISLIIMSTRKLGMKLVSYRD